MAAKKNTSKKPASEKTVMDKIGEKASHLKDEIIAGKDHLVEMAGDAIDSVKTTIKKITHKKKAPAKKAAKAKVKKAIAKRVNPAIKKAAKKVTPKKKVVKKVAKKTIIRR